MRQIPEEGFPLLIDDRPLLNLKVSYRCVWNADRSFLSVDECDYAVLPAGQTEPLFRYHFVRKQTGGLPGAHLHVHGHRDEVVASLLGGRDRGRVRSRLQNLVNGRYPRLADLHFPLGGPRFRPSMEDVIDMARVEFGIEVLDTADGVLANGRRAYRQMQLMTAVGDDPLTAAAELGRLGYVITGPDEVPVMKDIVF